MIDDIQVRDWPSAEFERAWSELEMDGAVVTTTATVTTAGPGDRWQFIQGRVEQSTPLGAAHPGGVEAFVRGADGAAVAAYLPDARGIVVGERVALVGISIPAIALHDRQGVLREYQAVVARVATPAEIARLGGVSRSSAESSTMLGGWIGALAMALVGAWVATRIIVRRGQRDPFAKVHAAAERAR